MGKPRARAHSYIPAHELGLQPLTFLHGGTLTTTPKQAEVLDRAIVATVVYADVFDYPLTAEEVQRYLIGTSASRGTVRGVLTNSRLVPGILGHSGRYYTIKGRE